MSNLHVVEIRSGGKDINTQVFLDGTLLRGVQSVRFDASVGGDVRVVISILPRYVELFGKQVDTEIIEDEDASPV